ncbi:MULTISPECIES: VOC family protein [Variovorax]|jgi:catechol 2,3-dioxygenase-like lactoylglutathione lyase family enzyme|uniref:VOC family protein n=1 Tax=Variovorax TaxID=34072 RepID=UPI00086A77FB|nr:MULTISPECIES: VOC family protein [Variovorax]MBN8758612.1 VOC family protein [Variovorax sp.]ODU11650.1 MAG: metapyrocatechase [Variovorax sp. SCN 67-85]ODV14985.1 MAG: metapyrocatechase [Variovorax sp. SCN 67-20]OJZ05295.1 MAG: metapyrocatechase [Variovorax sp. 67-131]UKI05266.1 VOC family protein [Variovorax paradoxus]
MAEIQLRTRKSAHRAALHSVHSLDAFVFTVPDLDKAEHFYDAFGLQPRREGGRLDLYTLGHPHAWGSLHQAPGVKKLQYLRFACFEEDFDAIAERIARLEVPRCAPHPLGDDRGLWVLHPEGFAVQIVVAAKSAPDEGSEPVVAPRPPVGTGASLNRSRIPKVHPRRLSHILMFCAKVPEAVRFYEDALGLRVTDRSGDHIVFMHGVHGSDHHLIAMARSSGPGLHHLSWDVADIDEVGRGMEQMFAAGHVRGWGVGRHVLGSNYFHYVRDPWGSYSEYSCDMDFVPGDFDWRAADHPPEDSFYAWGPRVPEDFITNFEIEAPAAGA